MSERRLFLLLFVILTISRLCHIPVMWPEETLPAAAGAQMLWGSVLYRDAWFDKPPLLAAVYTLWGASDGWPLRIAGSLHALLVCWLAYRMARSHFDERVARYAASAMAFFLIFDTPAVVMPLAADLLMVAPHLAAVWFASTRRPLAAGVCAGIAFSINSKGLFVLAACALWDLRALPMLAAGFAIPNALIGAWLVASGAWSSYVEQVWTWGRIYAADTFVENPLAHGLRRSANWIGFHLAIAIPAVIALRKERRQWLAWVLVSIPAVVLGMRFFPRYYFQLLPAFVILGARGLTLIRPRHALAIAALAVVPLIRFGPRYVQLASHGPAGWSDAAIDQDSREAAAVIRAQSKSGDTLLVWGFRSEMLVYTGLRSGTRFLESQPLTGVAADRHLFNSKVIMPELAERHRRELIAQQPDFIADGLGPMNPALAITSYPDLAEWLLRYEEIARTSKTVIYKRR